MKKDIIISGVGGQGILTIASVIGVAAMNIGLHLKQSEVHGMSQRGGDVQSHLRISDNIVFSDLIPMGACDLIISVEPMESLRYIPWLNEEGWVITNSMPYENIPNYPPISEIITELDKINNHIYIDADGIAANIKSPRSGNMVVLGAASSFIGIIPFNEIENAINYVFGSKGNEIAEKNILALNEGRRIASELLRSKK